MLKMEEYTFTFKMVNKTKNSGSERVAGLTPPVNTIIFIIIIIVFIIIIIIMILFY